MGTEELAEVIKKLVLAAAKSDDEKRQYLSKNLAMNY